MIEFVDKTDTTPGTYYTRANMMAIQGFVGESTVFNTDGSITKTNARGETLTIVFNTDGSITKTFSGEKTITMTIAFNEDGSIEKSIS